MAVRGVTFRFHVVQARCNSPKITKPQIFARFPTGTCRKADLGEPE